MVIEVNTWGGSPAFHHCAWALDMDGLGFSLDEFDEATYIGVYIDDSATESTDPEDYQWRPIGTSILDTAQAIDDLQAQMDDALADTFEADANIQGTQGASDTGLGNPNMLRRTNQGTTGWTAIGDLSLSAMTDTIYDESAEPVSFVRVTCSAAGDNALTFDATALRAILGTLSDESSLTISCDVRMSDLFTIDTVAVQDADGTNAQVDFDAIDNEPVDTETMDTSGTWMQYISTAVAPGSVDESAQVLFFDLSNMPAGATLDIANLKIELGAIATPWRDTIEDVKELAEDAAKTATNYLSYNSNTGLDVGYTGTSAKTRVTGNGVEIFDGDGNSAAFFGIEDNSPVSRVGDATAGHVVVDSDSVDVMDGSDTLASFGEYAIIGKEDGNRMKVSPESIIGLTAGNVESFKITQQSFTSDIQVVENSAPFIPNGSMFAYTLKNTPKNNETISCSIFAYSNTGKKYHADDISLLQDPDFEQTYYDEHGHVRIDVQPTIGINIVLEAGVTIQTQYKYYPVVSDAGKYGNFGNDAKTLYIEVNDINHHLSKIELVFSYTSVVSEVPSYTFGSRLESASIGELSFTEGTQVFASGVNSHAEGVFTGASGASSHAEGSMSYAFGPHSHSEGYSTHANGFAAHTEGNNSSANGDYSHAQNYGTIAAKTAQTVLGTYNEEDTSTTTTHPQGTNDYGTYALIIGNGSLGSGRSNALTVDWLGNVAIAGNLTQVPVTGTITYQTDWGAYSGQTPVLKKAANVVSLNGAFAFSGTAFTSSATEVPVCTIPEGFRPPAMVGVLCQGSGTNLWMLRVNTNGNVTMSRYRNAAGTYQQVTSSSWFPFSATWIVS